MEFHFKIIITQFVFMLTSGAVLQMLPNRIFDKLDGKVGGNFNIINYTLGVQFLVVILHGLYIIWIIL